MHNVDSVLVVMDHPTGAVPAGWTHFQSDGLIARRTSWAGYAALHLTGKKVVAIKVYQFKNAVGDPDPYENVIDGNDSYAVESDPITGRLRVTRQTASGGGQGATRIEFFTASESGGTGGGTSESWPSNASQVPMLGVALQDASPSTAKLNAAHAIGAADVPLG